MGLKDGLVYSVYYHENKTNGKLYFGITSQTPERRWRNGDAYHSRYFRRAIDKYGWDGFYHVVVKRGLTLEEATAMEKELISTYRTSEKEYGYNITEGGDGKFGCERTWFPTLGKKMSDDTKQKIRDRALERMQNPTYMQKMRNCQKTKPIICIETGEIFSCTGEAVERGYGTSQANISGCCHGRNKTSGGYHWMYVEDYERKPS